MLALLAGVQVESTLRALPKRLAQILQQRPALGATGNRPRPGHVDRSRSEGVIFFGRRGFFELLLRFLTGVLVSPLPVFTIGQKRLLKRLIVRFWRVLHKSFFAAATATALASNSLDEERR